MSDVQAKDIEKKINEHTRRVENRPLAPENPVCPYCEAKENFYLHERRVRCFLIVLACLVKKVKSLLARWKCPRCKRTWAEYPDFCEPYKRYVKLSMLRVTQEYLEEKGEDGKPMKSYAQVAKGSSTARGYVKGEEEIIDKQLSPSTVWRLVGVIGSLEKSLQGILRLIKEARPEMEIAQRIKEIPAYKYRSGKRKEILERAMRLLQALKMYDEIFTLEIYPDLRI